EVAMFCVAAATDAKVGVADATELEVAEVCAADATGETLDNNCAAVELEVGQVGVAAATGETSCDAGELEDAKLCVADAIGERLDNGCGALDDVMANCASERLPAGLVCATGLTGDALASEFGAGRRFGTPARFGTGMRFGTAGRFGTGMRFGRARKY